MTHIPRLTANSRAAEAAANLHPTHRATVPQLAMPRTLTTYHVMPLLPGREAELADDAEALLASGVCTHVACMMTLVPESEPPVDKAKLLGQRFLAFRQAFKGDPAKLGILAQATIGHGWVPDEPAPFQKIIHPDGSPAYQMCPLDAAFQAYIRHAFRQLAALRPAFFMVDDDFRLLAGRNGCYCPLHLAEISRRLERQLTREALLELLRQDNDAAQAYDKLLLDSLLDLAGVVRSAIDATDPAIPGSFCTCLGENRFAHAIARRLAGAGQQPVVRINNGRYLCAEMRSFPVRMAHTAMQTAFYDAETIILAETDTCPHNRYSTGANLLHAHYTGSILEGCHGAKHWLTRIGNPWSSSQQHASGIAYRNLLTRHRGFYEALFCAVQESRPAAYVAAALAGKPPFVPAPSQGYADGSAKTWAAIIGVLGLPCNYARQSGLPAMMTGEDVEIFSDDELRQLLRHGLLLDGPAAEALTRRGFAEAIGVQAAPWTGPGVSGERWEEVILPRDLRYSRLEPLGPAVRIHSTLLHRTSGVSEDYTELGPAVTLFENATGGRVAVLAASSGYGNSLTNPGLSFYDEDRKRELVELLGWVCAQPLPFYYPGDAELYLKLRRFADGRHLLALFNLGHDPLETIPLAAAQPVAKVEILAPDGVWRQIAFVNGQVQTPLLPAEPKILRVAWTQNRPDCQESA